MKSKKTWFIHTLVVVGFLSISAVLAKSWEVKGTKELSRGDLKGTSLHSTGKISLAPNMAAYDGVNGMYVWDLSAAPSGEATYIALGGPASVLRLKEGKVKPIHTTSEAHVTSVLAMKDGSVLAATAPRGIIYRIDAKGQVSVFADLEVKYVWDMVSLSERKWPVYCATGAGGRLLELSRNGAVNEVYDSPEQNLMCLAADEGDQVIYAGSEPDGLV